MAYDFYIGGFLNGDGLGSALSGDFHEVAKQAVIIQHRNSRAFMVGGHQQHGGQKWKPLAPSTNKRKGHAKILIQTGLLAASIFFKTLQSTPGRAVIGVGTDVEYAKYHQHGNARLPQRKVIDLTARDDAEFAQHMRDWALTAMNGRFAMRARNLPKGRPPEGVV